MTVLAHISDLHFGRENPLLIDGLLGTLRSIDPSLVVISGDFTQRATKRQYQASRHFLDNLPWPYLAIAGNHDIPTYNLTKRFFSPWRNWHRYIAEPLEPVVLDDEFIAIGINTARRAGSYLDWSRGRINLLQMRTVVSHLSEINNERLRVLTAHHPFWLPEKYRYRHTVSGHDLALQMFAEAGADIIMSGHVHFPYSTIENGLIISHAGTAVSSRLEKSNSNSFKIVRGDRRQLAITTMQWDGSSFSEKKTRLFYRRDYRWAAEDRP